jgi:hypothetical protein
MEDCRMEDKHRDEPSQPKSIFDSYEDNRIENLLKGFLSELVKEVKAQEEVKG